MKKLTLSMLIVSGALVAGMNQSMHSFSEFDANNNGKITQSEFETTQQKNMTEKAKAGYPMRNAGNAPTFSTIDTNKDGFINAQEFNARQQTNMKNQSIQRGNMNKGQGISRKNFKN